MYDSDLGRFFGVDPIAEKFPHVNGYNYAENEPVANIDMWGLQKAPAWLIDKTYAIFDNITGNSAIGKYIYRSGNEIKLTHKGEYTSRIAKDIAILAGAAITTYLSGGTGTGAYASAFGVTTGVFGMAAGGGKMGLDIMGNYEKADAVPGSPLGGIGLAIDDLVKDKKFSAQAIGDIASGFLLLSSANWQAFDALNNTDKIMIIMGIVDGIAKEADLEVNSESVAQEVLHQIYKPCEEDCYDR